MKRFLFTIIFGLPGLGLLATGGVKLFEAIAMKPVVVEAGTPATVTMREPGRIVLWYYTESVRDGTYVAVKEIPDGMKVDVTYAGLSLPVTMDRGTTASMGDGERRSIFSVEAAQVGDYIVLIDRVSRDHRFAATEGSGLGGFFVAIVMTGLGAMFLFLAAIFLILALTNTFPKTDAGPNKN